MVQERWRKSATAAHEIRVIGGFALLGADGPVDLRNRKAQAIVAHIALSSPPVQPRERLAFALWSERAAEQARQSLRQTLHDLRRALGAAFDELVDVRRDAVGLRHEAFTVDVLSLVDALEAGAPPPSDIDWAALPQAILPGFDEVDGVFGEWLAARRIALIDRVTAGLEHRLTDADDDAARHAAQALQALEPSHEPACRRLMESDAARGDLRGALKRYAALWDLLDDEFAAEPSPETQALAVKLKSIEAPPPAAVAGGRPALTLSMGEFRLDGVDERHGYLVRGFRQDLIASLTPYREWVVVEPGEGAPPPRADGVYEIEGLAFPSRDGVRLNVTLKESAARRFIWGQQDIDLTIMRWFETCRVTTRRIAAALDVRIAGDRLARRSDVADVSLPLYDKLLKARDLMAQWTPEADQRAEAIFRDILRADPGFSRAQIGIAKIMNSGHIVFPGVRRLRPGESEAVRLAQAAVDADPLDSEALLCLGWSLAMAGRCDEAVAPLLASCEANPTSPSKLASAADALANCGAQADAERYAQTSLDLDLGASRLNWGYRVAVHLHGGRLETAVEAARRSQSTIPLAGGYEAVARARMGDLAGAKEAWARYCGWVRSRWKGAEPPEDAAIARWFVAAPPMVPLLRSALVETVSLVSPVSAA
ncbi:BTAD domain-containing putative transcriptional regulator [Rubrimonas cliftonensis]|uniref:DNA-binding transcriptional activator of the SARP family n=1 Tax=Rubrimonas cliftonensis TaxID=89524 RepID=A0A1H3VUY5_9RHOB|nr:BTAD domain-containing putative transcriptional regulator [Rubrimonas cliftonensis]SDZ78586.1 DNA-binding transcriptional activator of the SARP family [Rubrimonas cliftonensis]